MTARGMVQRLKSERGQALVELVIVLPLMFTLIFLIAYAGVGFTRYLQVTDAARIGARAGAVARFSGQTPCPAAQAAATAAMDGLTIDFDPPCVISPDGRQITFSVTYQLPEFPLLPPVVDHVTSTVTERVE